MASRPDVRARHRARRSGTRRRILDTALALLEDRRWHEITPELVMAEAGLTRTAFYGHFPSREALLVALLEDLGVRLEDLPAAWERGDGEPIAELRKAIGELTTLYARVGRLLGAVAEAAAQDDDIRALHVGLAERLVAAVAERIAADVEAPVTSRTRTSGGRCRGRCGSAARCRAMNMRPELLVRAAA